jgi:hypothetical protein
MGGRKPGSAACRGARLAQGCAERADLQFGQHVGGRDQAPDFRVDARLLRRGLLDNGYGELPVMSEHAMALDSLPPIHKDPFDRVLIAQPMVEGITLLTADPLVAQYPGPIRMV